MIYAAGYFTKNCQLMPHQVITKLNTPLDTPDSPRALAPSNQVRIFADIGGRKRVGLHQILKGPVKVGIAKAVAARGQFGRQRLLPAEQQVCRFS